jgi:putative effector of murein hydrolase
MTTKPDDAPCPCTLAAGDIAKLVGILTVGMAATLLFTGGTAVFIRNALKTEMKEVTKAKPSPPFALSHYVAWGTIAVVSLVGSFINPTTWGPELALPFNVACTVGGYLLGCLVPKNLHGVLHPVVVCAVLANAGAALHGSIVGWSYSASLKAYLAKGAGPMGAGDLLMSFLGMVIISFGFKVYAQRDTMRRHAPEIMGACILSSLFSMFSTAFMAKALALPSDLSRAIIPRSVTVALALPIATQLDAPLAITAAAVLLQGLLGANFGPDLMTKFGIKDTIARGLAAAATAGGLGTASLTSREPEALPFCALSYSMIGILSTVFASIPFVREALIAIVG